MSDTKSVRTELELKAMCRGGGGVARLDTPFIPGIYNLALCTVHNHRAGTRGWLCQIFVSVPVE
jgi:hypothetical protein